MLELQEIKEFLRIDGDTEDNMLQSFARAAESYIKSACGENVDVECEHAKLIMKMIVADYYENRQPYGSAQYTQVISSMLLQLQLETNSAERDT